MLCRSIQNQRRYLRVCPHEQRRYQTLFHHDVSNQEGQGVAQSRTRPRQVGCPHHMETSRATQDSFVRWGHLSPIRCGEQGFFGWWTIVYLLYPSGHIVATRKPLHHGRLSTLQPTYIYKYRLLSSNNKLEKKWIPAKLKKNFSLKVLQFSYIGRLHLCLTVLL